MAKVNFEIKNKAGFVSQDVIEDVKEGTEWHINENKITVGDVEVEARPVPGFKFIGNWCQDSDSGTIEGDTTFTADFINYIPEPGNGTKVSTYSFLLRDNTDYCIDVYGASLEMAAPLDIYGRNNTPAQNWGLFAGRTPGWTEIVNQNNFRSWFVSVEMPPDSQFISLRSDSECIITENEWRWEARPYYATINGVSYQGYRFEWAGNSNYVVDNQNGSVMPGNWLIAYLKHDDPMSQTWIPMKIAYLQANDKMPSIAIDGETDFELDDYGSVNVELSGAEAYQWRIRSRTLMHNSNTWSAWSNWGSPTGLLSDEGWGDAWNANSDGSESYIISGGSSYTYTDSVQYEINARSFREIEEEGTRRFPVASNINSYTFSTRQIANISIDEPITMNAYGLVFHFASNVYRTVNYLTFVFEDLKVNGEQLADRYELSGVHPFERTAYLPFSKIKFLPEDGATIQAKVSVQWNDDYIKDIDNASVSGVVSYGGGTLTPHVEFEYINKYDIKATITDTGLSYKSLSLIYKHLGSNGQKVISPISEGSNIFRIPAPLNTDFSVLAFIEKGYEWGVGSFDIKSSEISGSDFGWNKNYGNAVINSGNQELALRVFKVYAPNENHWTFGTIESELNGKKLTDVYPTGNIKNKIDLKECILSDDDFYKLQTMLNDGTCLLRTEKGGFHYCVINDIGNQKLNNNYVQFDLSFTETNYELEISI